MRLCGWFDPILSGNRPWSMTQFGKQCNSCNVHTKAWAWQLGDHKLPIIQLVRTIWKGTGMPKVGGSRSAAILSTNPYTICIHHIQTGTCSYKCFRQFAGNCNEKKNTLVTSMPTCGGARSERLSQLYGRGSKSFKSKALTGIPKSTFDGTYGTFNYPFHVVRENWSLTHAPTSIPRIFPRFRRRGGPSATGPF